MSNQNIQQWFNRFKKEGEEQQLSKTHVSNFEARLHSSETKKKGLKLTWVYRVAAVLVLGILLVPMAKGFGDKVHPDFEEYQKTKSYFTAYVEYEVGRHQEEITPENETLIQSALHEVVKLQYDYAQLEKEFIKQNYDKRILKRMIDNFRQQLDILENIDMLLKSSKQTTKTDENII